MVEAAPPDQVPPLAQTLRRGARLRPDAAGMLENFFGLPVGREGLSRALQPSFPGVRVFVIEPRLTVDRSVEFRLVGVSRRGEPVFRGRRVIGLGRDGSLEIHHGFDEVDPEYRSRNLLVDGVERELELLSLVRRGPAPRLTADAVGPGRYISALHGFRFADETPEGPPLRSEIAAVGSDRERLRAYARVFVQRFVESHGGLDGASVAAVWERIEAAEEPWQFAALDLPQAALSVPEDEEGIAGGLGRAIMLADDCPPWRAAFYLEPRAVEAERYRRRKTTRYEARLAFAVDEAQRDLESLARGTRIRAIEQLGLIASSHTSALLRPHLEAVDRRVAVAARAALARIGSASLPDELLDFARSEREDFESRGLACRVLAEYFPQKLTPYISMFRVHPSPYLQRAIVPCLSEHREDAGPELASMLSANPWRDGPRPGLLEMRLELIERLTHLVDPRTLPALLEALACQATMPPSETFALSKALMAYPDPRARAALSSVAQNLDRPQIP